MWVKAEPLQFIQIDKASRLFPDTRPMPMMVKDSEWDGLFEDGTLRKSSKEWREDHVMTTGIFLDLPEEYILIREFTTIQEAEQSLVNLFRAWSRYRSSLYLIPQGLDWVIEAIGREKGGK